MTNFNIDIPSYRAGVNEAVRVLVDEGEVELAREVAERATHSPESQEKARDVLESLTDN